MERVYTVPLRRAYNAAHKYRARAAMKALRAFIARHMKVEEGNVKIHESVNHAVWKRGARKPPRRLKVVAVREGDVVWVYTPEARKEQEVKRAEVEKKEKEEERAEDKEKTGKGATQKGQKKGKRGKKGAKSSKTNE